MLLNVLLFCGSLISHFEIVFSSLYKFCEGMFRRETVHSHLFVHFSPFSLFFCSASCRLLALSAIFPCVGIALWGSLLIALSCRSLPLGKFLRGSPRHGSKVRHRHGLAFGVLRGRMSVVFLFLFESRKKPCHPGENVEQNAADNPGRKRERTRRERQEF